MASFYLLLLSFVSGKREEEEPKIQFSLPLLLPVPFPPFPSSFLFSRMGLLSRYYTAPPPPPPFTLTLLTPPSFSLLGLWERECAVCSSEWPSLVPPPPPPEKTTTTVTEKGGKKDISERQTRKKETGEEGGMAVCLTVRGGGGGGAGERRI